MNWKDELAKFLIAMTDLAKEICLAVREERSKTE